MTFPDNEMTCPDKKFMMTERPERVTVDKKVKIWERKIDILMKFLHFKYVNSNETV